MAEAAPEQQPGGRRRAGAAGPLRPTHRQERLKLAWLLAPPFLYLARPTSLSLLGGGLLALAGLAVRALAANAIHKDRSLAVRGPYAHLRHPLYLGSFLVGMGLATAGGRVLFLPPLLLLFAWVYWRATRAEETELEERFGEAYRRYRAQVPALLPRRRPYRVGESGPDPAPDPLLPSAGPLRLYRRNREWEAALGVLVGFGLLWVRMVLG